MRSPFFIFIGNADEIFAPLLPGSIPAGPKRNVKVGLIDIVNFQIEQIHDSLFENDCSEVMKEKIAEGSKPPTSIFLAISDGEGKKDSRIQAFYYTANADGEWEREQNLFPRDWQLTGDEFNPSSGNPFELHLPTQVEKIVDFFANNQGREYDQYFYFFKTHGTKFASKTFHNNLLTHMSQKLPADVKSNHSFMFDANGPEKNKSYTSELYSPYWMPLSGCRALSEDSVISKQYLQQNPGFCQCKKILLASNKPLKNFSSCAAQKLNDDFIFGFDFNKNLGASKSLFYRSFTPLNGDGQISKDQADGIKQVGGAVSYDMALPKVKGVETWSLPFGKYPTLIILDSCKGDPAVANIIKAHDTQKTWRDRIITITSENLVSNNIMNYSSLSASQYVMLANIYAMQSDDLASLSQELNDEAYYIRSHLSHQGLIDLKWVSENWKDGKSESIDTLKIDSLNNNNKYRYFHLNVH